MASDTSQLISNGYWRENSSSTIVRARVFVSHDALEIDDLSGRPLSHWSIAAINRKNPESFPAVYMPDGDGDLEMLEINDTYTISEIENAIALLPKDIEPQSRPRKRFMIRLAMLTALSAAGVYWGPDALRHQAASAVPQSRRDEIGNALLEQIQRLSRPACNAPQGLAALERLKTSLEGTQDVRFAVLPGGIATAYALPGNIIVINQTLLQTYDDPTVVAAHIQNAVHNDPNGDRLLTMLKTLSLPATFQLLTTGSIPTQSLDAYAKVLINTLPAQTVYQNGPVDVMIDDTDWVAVQGICDT